mgnify:FL=1
MKLKYTNYLINGEVLNMDNIQTNNKYFKLPVILISIPVAIFGLMLIGGTVPMAISIDGVRAIKYYLIHQKRTMRH